PAARGSALTTIADVTGDGRPDVIVSDGGDSQLTLLLNQGGGRFTVSSLTTGPNPGAVTVARVNGDGKPDLIVSNYHTGAVSEFLGLGGGRFGPPRLLSGGSGPYPATVTADVNGDGRPDLI